MQLSKNGIIDESVCFSFENLFFVSFLNLRS